MNFIIPSHVIVQVSDITEVDRAEVRKLLDKKIGDLPLLKDIVTIEKIIYKGQTSKVRYLESTNTMMNLIKKYHTAKIV